MLSSKVSGGCWLSSEKQKDWNGDCLMVQVGRNSLSPRGRGIAFPGRCGSRRRGLIGSHEYQ